MNTTRPSASQSYDFYEELGEDMDRRGNYNHNSARVFIGERGKTLLLGVLIAANLLGMMAMWYEWRESAMEQRLKEYNLDWFRNHEFAELKEQVAVQQQLINNLQRR